MKSSSGSQAAVLEVNKFLQLLLKEFTKVSSFCFDEVAENSRMFVRISSVA